jgi:alkanesulfonate monooxygenase SsuD/methylene tetrahydromethanopterin reductase-like flavin-dependent oxidoreductase (luciferase family)
MLNDALACAIVGAPDTVGDGLAAFVERTEADELMVTANIFDHMLRKRSFQLVAEAHQAMASGPA